MNKATAMTSNAPVPIRIESIGKCFRIFQNPQDRFKQALLDRFHGISGQQRFGPLYREHWALKDISFELQAGEAIGILGRNGAGKSTLLQIIAGTLEPTEGRLTTSGRITALLELGSGFNPEFTGRENVFLNAQILGLSREDILDRFDDIASFADIGDFLEQPVKTYSSGMMMRLAFSVQVLLNPDVLIVDEALAVGDAKFQEKCYRMLRSLREEGGSILFVSHDNNAVASFCDRAILLDGGTLVSYGKPKEVVKSYHDLLFGGARTAPSAAQPYYAGRGSFASGNTTEGASQSSEPGGFPQGRFGNSVVEILDVTIVDERGVRTDVLVSGKSYRIIQTVVAHDEVVDLSSGFIIRNNRGVDLFGITNKTAKVQIPSLNSGTVIEVAIDVDMWLAAGDYFLQAANAGADGTQYDWQFETLQFKVVDTPSLFTTAIVNLAPKLAVRIIEAGEIGCDQTHGAPETTKGAARECMDSRGKRG